MHRAVMLLILLCCRPSGQAPKDAGGPADARPQTPDIAVHSPTMEDKIREAVKNFVLLVERCDEQYFSRVSPENIKRWELPVDVKAMEQECDALLEKFEDLLEYCLRNETLDRFLDTAAFVADRYLLLCLRCKKVGVRDKIPYIKEVSELRDALRTDVVALKGFGAEVLRLPDEDLSASRWKPENVAPLAHRVFLSLRDRLKDLVERPLEEGRPVPRYALRLTDRRANVALTLLRTKAPATDQAILGPAEALTRAFSAATNLFIADYFNAEEKLIRRVIRDVLEADRKYRVAANRFMKRR